MYLSPLAGEFIQNGRKLKLTEKLVFEDKTHTIEVPKDFVTDFNSVPRGLWNVFPPWEYPEAGVVHDYLYRLGLGTRKEADAIHRRILEHLECPRVKRYAAWVALRVFGGAAWRG